MHRCAAHTHTCCQVCVEVGGRGAQEGAEVWADGRQLPHQRQRASEHLILQLDQRLQLHQLLAPQLQQAGRRRGRLGRQVGEGGGKSVVSRWVASSGGRGGCGRGWTEVGRGC